MATIEKRERKKGTVYQVDIRVRGYPRQKKTFKRLTDAKAWAAKTESEINSGQHVPSVAKSQRRAFSDVLDRYEGEILPHLAQSTQRASQTYLKHWRAELGAYGLSFITSEQISKSMRQLATSNDKRTKDGPESPKSRKTLKHYRDTLDVLFKKAVTWGWLSANPMNGVDAITNIRNERTRFLSDEEREALLDECKRSPNPVLYTIVVFALATGCRKGEILNLTLTDVDLTRGAAVLRNTKNGETRSVALVGHLVDLLWEQIAFVSSEYDRLWPDAPTRWLFPRRDMSAPLDIRKAWENALKRTGISDFRFHDLRHSTASYLAMQGASMVEIADMLGHKTLQMVKRYAHLSSDHKKGLAAQLDNQIFGKN